MTGCISKLKVNIMKLNLNYILIGIALLLLSFFIGRWTSPKDVKTVTITVPAKSGESPVITDFTQVTTTKDSLIYRDSLIYKDSLIYTENPFNKELADKYTKLEEEKEKLTAYLNAIQIKKYQIPYENDTLKIVGNIEVQGELRSVQYDWNIKQFKTEAGFKVPKKTISLFVGGMVSNTIELDKFNVYASAGLQRRNGDIFIGSYGLIDKSIQAGYLLNIKF